MGFYQFTQNNTGGDFQVNDDIAHFVLIEADSYKEANNRAENVGVYFNGCDTGEDCPCCGDRWYELEDYDDNTNEPLIYGSKPNEYNGKMFKKEYRIHYLDGRVEKGNCY